MEEKACGEDRNGNEEYAGCYAIERFAADGVKQNAAEQVAENAGDLRHGMNRLCAVARSSTGASS